MELNGKIIKVLPLESGVGKQSGKEWKRATLIVEYGEGQYPKQVAISNMKNADAFAALAVGTTGTFHIEPTSREFNGKYYTNVDCWKWEVEQAQQVAPTPITPQPVPSDSLGDPLPF